jgi:hypothetical protein
VARDIAEAGWRRARARLKDELAKQDEVGVNVALGETIFWLSVIEDDEERTVGKTAYYGRRDASTEGQTVRALVFARNLVAHRLVEPASRTVWGGLGTSPLGTTMLGTGGVSWSWKARSNLASPPPLDPKGGRDVFYDAEVGGNCWMNRSTRRVASSVSRRDGVTTQP